MANTQYITAENDRWDLIALKAYGDCTKKQIKTIMDANPYETTKDFFKAGVHLIIPISEDQQTENIEALLPPWKRSSAAGDVTEITNSIQNGPASDSGSFDGSFD